MEEKYVFFWKTASPFSNWHPSKFTLDGQVFENMEQYMMWSKAMLMVDTETAQKILLTSDPRTIKALGREVRNFNSYLWDKVKYGVVYGGCYAKFTQNEKIKKVLMDTGDKVLVEASPFDKIWGIGLHWEDDDVLDESKWKGQNLLGKALMEVRKQLSNGKV